MAPVRIHTVSGSTLDASVRLAPRNRRRRGDKRRYVVLFTLERPDERRISFGVDEGGADTLYRWLATSLNDPEASL